MAFQKGHTPWCKGKKLSAEQKKNMLQPGNTLWSKRKKVVGFKKGVAQAYREIGSEKVQAGKHGYILVKVADPSVWRLKQRVVFENHFGPIPIGLIITFRDGDVRNCKPENLCLKSRKQLMDLNTVHYYGPDMFKVFMAMGRLTRELKKHAKPKRPDRP